MLGLLASLATAVACGGGERMGVEEARAALDRAVAGLLSLQRPDGSFASRAPDCIFDLGYAPETYAAWAYAGQALASMALAQAPPSPERQVALTAAIDYWTSAAIPRRGSDWDTDSLWSELYGSVACIELTRADSALDEGRRAALERLGRELVERLGAHESIGGGFGYYDDPPYDRRGTWATSFCTALVLPALAEAAERGWQLAPGLVERARAYVADCALPGGAFEYDRGAVTRLAAVEHINLPEGSLGRTQVCNWALASMGDPRRGADVLRAGLERFFRDHGFLDHVRTRPVPHEGFHSNAGYFYFFGHYYAARVIELLPAAERARWHERLRPELVKTLWRSGLTSDFLDTSYMVVSSTSFLILALAAGLDDHGSP